jgi:hypothetical protein
VSLPISVKPLANNRSGGHLPFEQPLLALEDRPDSSVAGRSDTAQADLPPQSWPRESVLLVCVYAEAKKNPTDGMKKKTVTYVPTGDKPEKALLGYAAHPLFDENDVLLGV